MLTTSTASIARAKLQPKLIKNNLGRLTFTGIEFKRNSITGKQFPVLLFRLRATVRGEFLKMNVASSSTMSDNSVPFAEMSKLCQFAVMTGLKLPEPATIQDKEEVDDLFGYDYENQSEDIFDLVMAHCENVVGHVFTAQITEIEKPNSRLKTEYVFNLAALEPLTHKGEPVEDEID